MWIIIDKVTEKALHGVNGLTLLFSTKEIAEEVGKQFFFNMDDFLTIKIVI